MDYGDFHRPGRRETHLLLPNPLMLKARALPAALALLAVTFLTLYRPVILKLVHDWATDGNYSHGFLVVPLAAYFAWARSKQLSRLPVRPHWTGALLVVSSMAVLLAGQLGAELFLMRISILGTLVGTIVFLLGWRHVLALAFPLAFLLLMIPIPAIVFNQIAFPLQLLASSFGETVLSACHIPVLREGNVIILANTTLEVAEACSGIRSLVSLLTLAIVYGYFVDQRGLVRAALALLQHPDSRSSPTGCAWPAPASPRTSTERRPPTASCTRSPDGSCSSRRLASCAWRPTGCLDPAAPRRTGAVDFGGGVTT